MVKNTKLAHTSPTLITLCILFVALVIFLPSFLKESKSERLNLTLYQSKIVNEKQESSVYSKFWNRYDIILKERGDTNGDKMISLEEKQTFDNEFFGDLGLSVDPVTKIVKKNESYDADPKAIICRLDNFYPDKPWIKPICTEL